MKVAPPHNTLKSQSRWMGMGQGDGSYPLNCYDFQSTCVAKILEHFEQLPRAIRIYIIFLYLYWQKDIIIFVKISKNFNSRVKKKKSPSVSQFEAVWNICGVVSKLNSNRKQDPGQQGYQKNQMLLLCGNFPNIYIVENTRMLNLVRDLHQKVLISLFAEKFDLNE